MTLQLDLILVWWVVIHPLRPSTSTDLEGHPIAEDEPSTNNRQQQANAVECCYSVIGKQLDQFCHDCPPLMPNAAHAHLLALLPPQQPNLSRHRAWGFPHSCPYACCPGRVSSAAKQKADNADDNEIENRADHHAAHSAEQHEDVGLTKQHPTIRAPMKALRMQVTEKPRESQMSPLSLMFAALLVVIVGTSALA